MSHHLVLFDDSTYLRLLPLTFTRPVSALRTGILTIAEKWAWYFAQPPVIFAAEHLRAKFPVPIFEQTESAVFVNASMLPSPTLCRQIEVLKTGQAIIDEKRAIVIAFCPPDPNNIDAQLLLSETFAAQISQKYAIQLPPAESGYEQINHWWHLFERNGQALWHDFGLLTANRQSIPLSANNRVTCPENIFVEEGASIEHALLNAQNAPIYVGKHAEIMEGVMVRGGLSLGEHATLKMGAKVYGATTIGPHCKIGGEIGNSVILGYSNKGHDGYLGNSVLGEWCNLGADTNNSNLKNNYSTVSVWSYEQQKQIDTQLQFCGMVMGDHSKTAINTMLNTGTVVGVCTNIFGAGFPPKHIPSFTWGMGNAPYEFDKAIETAERVYERRKQTLTPADREVLRRVWALNGGTQ